MRAAPVAAARKQRLVATVVNLVNLIRASDEAAVENAVLALSQQSRWLAPLAFLVGAFAMLFQGVKLLVTNWRLTLVVIVPAMWIWAAMLDLKVHVLHGKDFHIPPRPRPHPPRYRHHGDHRGQLLPERGLRLRHLRRHGPPQIRPAFAKANAHLKTIVAWGGAIGLALSFSTLISSRGATSGSPWPRGPSSAS